MSTILMFSGCFSGLSLHCPDDHVSTVQQLQGMHFLICMACALLSHTVCQV